MLGTDSRHRIIQIRASGAFPSSSMRVSAPPPAGSGRTNAGRRRREDRSWDDSRSSASSGSSAPGGPSSTCSGVNRVRIAARAIASCFTSPESRSSPPANHSKDSLPPSRSQSASSQGSMRGSRRRGLGIHSGSSDPTSREPGGMRLTIAEIMKATKNFSPSLKIGQGGSGTVYRGQLDDGTIVAVKRSKKNVSDSRRNAEFHNEIQTLASIEHLNLVRLHGYLEYENEMIVVVEYVPNGTLREHLDCLKGTILDLASRLDIAIDVAHAVTYLHVYSDTPIIHRDIKSSNILITNNLRAKVADFGFAKVFAIDSDATHVSTQVKGTAGYLDPEYLKTYQLTVKSDVYSFGVLLVELVSGRRPIETKRELHERLTTRWAMNRFNEGNGIKILDPNLDPSPSTNFAVEKILELASKCLAQTKRGRPSMRKCAEILWTIRKDYRELLSSNPTSASSY